IRNNSNHAEQLKMGLRSFTVNDSGEVQLATTAPTDVSSWVTFASPTFSIDQGAWYTQKITFAVPKDAGFSYSFAIIISRSSAPAPGSGHTALEGSVAVFTLLGIDRPDATRELEVSEFTSEKRLYEYLPATFTVKLKNSGNTINQPYGNIYIQR